jgi:hypothetical protein
MTRVCRNGGLIDNQGFAYLRTQEATARYFTGRLKYRTWSDWLTNTQPSLAKSFINASCLFRHSSGPPGANLVLGTTLYSHRATWCVVQQPANNKLLAPIINNCLRFVFIISLSFKNRRPEKQTAGHTFSPLITRPALEFLHRLARC